MCACRRDSKRCVSASSACVFGSRPWRSASPPSSRSRCQRANGGSSVRFTSASAAHPPSEASWLASLWQTVLHEIHVQEGIAEAQVLNAWLWGSRWFGEQSANSDYDLMLVVSGWTQPRGKHYHVVKAPKVDICLFSEAVFAELVADLHSWTLAFMFYPPHGILLSRRQFSFRLELPRLYDTARADDVSNYTVAKRFWNRGMIRKVGIVAKLSLTSKQAKKRVCFILRMLDYAVQLAQHGEIHLHQNLNALFFEVCSLSVFYSYA